MTSPTTTSVPELADRLDAALTRAERALDARRAAMAAQAARHAAIETAAREALAGLDALVGPR